MRIMEPVLPREMETAIPLEEALAMAAAYEEPVYGYAFAGGSAAGHQLEKTEYKIPVKSQNPRFAQKEIPPYNQSTQAGSKP